MNTPFINTLQRLKAFSRVKLRCLMYLLPLLLALAGSSKSYAAFIIGRTPICINDTANYHIASPTPGIFYLWEVSPYGITAGSITPTINIQWVATGSTTLRAYGVDGLGDTVETAVLGISINPPSYPFLTTDYRVACQELAGTAGPQPQPPSIYDTSTCKKVCSGAAVTYNAFGAPGSSFTWSAPGATSITPSGTYGETCVIVWGSPGTRRITLTETNTSGCKGSTRWCVEVIDKPLAHFETYAIFSDNDNSTSNTIDICLEDNVLFKDLSTAPTASPILSCYWDFGDGKYTTTAAPTSTMHQYKTPGVFTAMLVVRNACGCTDTARVTVKVKPEIGLSITCPAVVCEGAIVGYKLHNYGSCPVFNWTVEGGHILPSGPPSDSITVIWDDVDSTGFGMVMFDGGPCSGGCNGSAILKIPVIQNRGTISGPNTICVGEPAIYRMPQWPTTNYNWNEASGTFTLLTTDHWNEIVVTASTPGTFVLRVNYRNTLLGCGGVAYDTITVLDKLDVIGTGKFCEGTNYTWNLSVLGALGNWTLVFPDGTGTILPNSNTFTDLLSQTGTYKLFVTGAFCKIDTITFDVTPRPPAVDDLLGPDKACPGVPTKYEATTNLAGYTFAWTATTGSASPVSSNITYATFSGGGPWTIEVYREDALGCQSPILSKNVVSPIVPVNISGPAVVCGSTVHTYSVDYLEGETYDWEIVDPLLGSVTLPTDASTVGVTWHNPPAGGATATLTVKVRKCGVVMTNFITVLINGAPTVTVSGPSSICSGDLATFSVSSTPALTSGTYSWDYGDGTTGSIGSHRYLVYTGTPTYNVILTVTGGNGCTTTATDDFDITVNPQPILNLKEENDLPLNHCGAATWTNDLADALGARTGSGFSYAWQFNGGSVLPSPYDTWTIPVDETNFGAGVYSLTITDPVTGCSTKDDIWVTDTCSTCDPTLMPTLSLTGSQTACAHLSLTGSWTPSGYGYNPTWIYDATDAYGVTTTSTTFDADFKTAGLKKITYVVKYLSGTDTCVVKKDTSIGVQFVPNISTNITCSGGTYTLHVTDFSTVYSSVPTRAFYVDGVFHSSGLMPFSTFSISTFTPGSTHNILLVLTPFWGPGFTCSTSVNITMPPAVTASFTIPKYNPACEDDAVVEFTNTTPGTGLKAHWDYGDFTTNDLWSPWKTYSDIGTYPVTLTITDPYGCSASTSQNVDVQLKDFTGILGASSALSCAGSPTLLTYSATGGTPMPVKYRWYEQENFLAENTSSTRTVIEPGGYFTFATSALGCKVKTPIVPVDYNSVPTPTITGDNEVCDGESYTLSYAAAAYPALIDYEWTKTGSGTGTYPGGPSHLFTDPPGTYTYVLRIIVTKGSLACTTYSAPYVVTVHPSPATPTIGMSVLDCDDYQVQLSASGGPGTYTWSSGDAGTPIIVRTGGPYRVWVTDVNGCIAFSNITVPIAPEVYKYVFPVGCYDLCSNLVPFTILGPKPPASFAKWDWLLGGSSVATGALTVPPYLVTAPGTYNLALDNGSCADTSDDLNISFKDCPMGCFGGLEFRGHFQTMTPPNCYDSIDLGITCPPGTTYTIFCDNGTLLPGTGVGPSPSRRFRYIADIGFSGPVDFITAIFTDPVTGVSCTVRIPLPFTIPPCANSMAKTTQNGTIDDGNVVVNEFARLQLSPNPASKMVKIEYGFTGKSNQRSLEVFDMAGRRIASEVLTNASGTATLNLENFSSGLYQVILRQDGNVFLHSKLSVVK